MTTIVPLIHTSHSLSNTNQQQRRRRVSINRCNSNNNNKLSLSEPTTPISPTSSSHKKKVVRFCDDDDLEQVRLFLKSQMPKMIRSGDPPFLQEPRYELKCIQWPSKLAMYKSLNQVAIRIENVQLEHDQVLFGRCRVANLAYEKKVMIRYSFDYWDTHQEVQASYREPIASTTNTWDRFTFELPLPQNISDNNNNKKVKPLTCFLALKYMVNDQEFWDNNDGKNYQLDLIPTLPSTPPLQLSDNEDEDEDDIIDLDDHQSSTTTSPTPTNNNNKKSHHHHHHQHPLDTHQLKHRYDFSNARQHSIPDTLPSLSPSLHVGYQDFISKYCFYNSSSILQN